jgi:urease accessory protein
MFETDSLWTLLQMADSALPVGGFVASNGLEASIQMGHCLDFTEFIKDSLVNVKFSQINFIRAAIECLNNQAQPLERLLEIDKNCETFVGLNHVNARASCAQGVAYLTLITSSFSECKHSDIAVQFKKNIRIGKTKGHLPVCFGITCFCLNISKGIFVLIKNLQNICFYFYMFVQLYHQLSE